MEAPKSTPAVPEISEAQRRCLSHILRNCESALEGFVYFLEEHHGALSHQEILAMLTPIHRTLGQILEASERGSYCALRSDQCAFVGPFVGCVGVKPCCS